MEREGREKAVANRRGKGGIPRFLSILVPAMQTTKRPLLPNQVAVWSVIAACGRKLLMPHRG